MFKNLAKIFIWLILYLTVVGGIIVVAKISYPAEAICFTNQFESDVHIWAISNKGKGSYKERHITKGEEACYVVDNGKRLLIKFEINHYKEGKKPNQRLISIGTFTPGFYNIRIEKDRLIIK